MYDDLFDSSLFDEEFDSEPECNCECGCTVPIQGQCVDCSEDSGHQNNNGLSKYDSLNEATIKRLEKRSNG